MPGSCFPVACVLLCVFVQAYTAASPIAPSPVLINALPVPVLGGKIQIFGLHLGNQSSNIKVQLAQSCAPSESSIDMEDVEECRDAEVVLSNSIISCSVGSVGTGKSKHIQITVDGETSVGCNKLFSRQGPKVAAVNYNHATSILEILGSNFGFNSSLITVSYNRVACYIVSADDSAITCILSPQKRRGTESGQLYVSVDGQGDAKNYSIPNPVVDSFNVSASSSVVAAANGQGFSGRSKMILVALAISCGVISLVILAYIFVARNRSHELPSNNKSSDNAASSRRSGEPIERFVDLHSLDRESESEEEMLANRSREKKFKPVPVTVKETAQRTLSHAAPVHCQLHPDSDTSSSISSRISAQASIGIRSPEHFNDEGTDYSDVYENDIPVFTSGSVSDASSSSDFSSGENSPFKGNLGSPILGTPPLRPASARASPAIKSPVQGRSTPPAHIPGRIMVTLPPSNSPKASRFSSLSRGTSPTHILPPGSAAIVLSPPASNSPKVVRAQIKIVHLPGTAPSPVPIVQNEQKIDLPNGNDAEDLSSGAAVMDTHANMSEFDPKCKLNRLGSSHSLSNAVGHHLGYFSPMLPRRARSPLPVNGIASPAINRIRVVKHPVPRTSAHRDAL